jgi:molybdopterin-synthase adenylyltransferase
MAKAETSGPGDPLAGGRYDRHRSLLSDSAWDTLCHTRFVIAGVGGLGTNVAQALARLGPVTLDLWDPATVDAPDLNRQVLYGPSDLGARKVEVAERALRACNPEVTIHAHAARIDLRSFSAQVEDGSARIILDCLDSFEARFGLEQIRRAHAIPVVHGGIEGWYGQACLFPGSGPGYTAVYGEGFAAMPPAAKPMMPHVVAAIASLEIGLLVDWLEHGARDGGPEALLVYDGRSFRLDRIALKLDEPTGGSTHGST